MRKTAVIALVTCVLLLGCAEHAGRNGPPSAPSPKAHGAIRDPGQPYKLTVEGVGGSDGGPAIAVVSKPADSPEETDWKTVFFEAHNANTFGKSLSSGTEVILLVGSGRLNTPDSFSVGRASQVGGRFSVPVEYRRFSGWDDSPELRKTNQVRCELAVVPLGVLADGGYEAELRTMTCSFDQPGHPEQAAKVQEGPKRRGEMLLGPVRCPFTVGKLSRPRLVNVYQGVLGRAHRDFYHNGFVSAGHMSGDDPPFVHIESAWAPRQEVQAIWGAAEALDLDALARREYPPSGEWHGRVSFILALPDGSTRKYEFPSNMPELRGLWDLMAKTGYGHW